MKKPTFLIIFRSIINFGIFILLWLLYWSSVLVENDLKEIKSELSALKNKPIYESSNSKPLISSSLPRPRPHMDSSLPNLLKEDPFYEKTLPGLLGKEFKSHGAIRNATIGKPENLHPFGNWAEVRTWQGMCGLSVAKMQIGLYETMCPYMAIKMEARIRKDSPVPEFWIHLRENVFWQPLDEQMFQGKVALADHFLKKHPVTAHDFKFYYDALMNPFVQKPGAVALRNFFGDIESIEVIDDLTFVVRWQTKKVQQDDGSFVEKIKYIAKSSTGSLSPLPEFVYKYFPDGTKIIEEDENPETYRTNSVWAQNFSEHWAKNIIPSCGPWIFKEMTDEQISFQRNPDHFSPLDCLILKSTYTFKNTPENIWNDFQTERVDLHTLLPTQRIELENFLKTPLYKNQENAGRAIKELNYNARAFAYIGWNMTRPYFKEKRVRQAMTMAIDRKRIITQYLNGMGIELTGPMSPFSPSYNREINAWPFDPMQAKRLLEQEGWYDREGEGVISKIIDGKKVLFEFKLTYFVKNPVTKSLCEYVTTALKEIGIRCLLNGVDLADLSASFDDKGFDALTLAWGLASPPEDIRQLWHSEGAKEPGSSNAVGFANKEVDKIIEKLSFEDQKEERNKLYHRFHEIIHDEQPYTFLYAPKSTLLYRDYVQNVFVPAMKQDLIPGANVEEPISDIFWIK